MAFSELDLRRIDKLVGGLCRQNSPAEYSDELRFVYDVDGHSVSIFEERPPWDGTSGEWTRNGVARFRYFRSRGEWTLYWMRADLKWHIYDEVDSSADLASLVRVVEEDGYCAFFG